jgi:hypothetical protein
MRWAAVGVWLCVLGLAPARALETAVRGVDLSATGYVEDRQGFEVQDTPDDRNFQELWLRLRAAYGDHVELDTTFATRNGGPTSEANHAGFHRWDAVFQSVSPAVEFEEAILRLKFDVADLRIGKQKIAWGKLDRTQPTDLLNVDRYNDPFLRDEDQNKIGVPAVNGSYYPTADWLPDESRVTLVWIPWYHPYRFPLFGERWFPPAAVPPRSFPIPPCIMIDQTEVELGFATPNASPPSFGLDNSGYAVRASAVSAGIDYAVMYYHGFDMQPAFELSATVFPTGASTVGATTELRPTFHMIDAWGGDAAWSWGAFTLRAEGAFIHGRPFSRDLRFLITSPCELADKIHAALAELQAGAPSASVALPPSFVVRDALEWGIGVDTTLDGYFFLLQLNQTDVFDSDVDLLIEDVETRLLGTVRKSFFHDDLQLQLQGIYGVSSDYTLLVPRITYHLGYGFEAQAGYLFIAGRRSSTGGQFKRNDEAFVRLRYRF